MNLKKVTWEYMQGTKSLLNLTTMMETAAKEIMPKRLSDVLLDGTGEVFSLDSA